MKRGERNRLGFRHEDLRLRNRSEVMTAIFDRGPICRRDIAACTGITPATVTNVVAELLAAKLVVEVGAERARQARRGGPNAILLDLAEGPPYVLALLLAADASRLHAALVTLRGKVVTSDSAGLAANSDVSGLQSAAFDLATRLCRGLDIDVGRDVLAAGFATHGRIRDDEGIIAWHRNPRLCRFDIAQCLCGLFGLPAFVAETSRSMALAEALFGEGRRYASFLYVFVHDVINGAIVAQGAVLVGARDYSFNAGHYASIEPNGLRCAVCRQRGCLDMLASDVALLREAQALAEKSESALSALANGGEVSREMIVEAARLGDAQCRLLLHRRGALLGEGVTKAVNFVDTPAAIVSLTGPESEVETKALLSAYSPYPRASENCARDIHCSGPEIVLSYRDADSAFLGPASLVVRQVLSPQLSIVPAENGKLVAALGAP